MGAFTNPIARIVPSFGLAQMEASSLGNVIAASFSTITFSLAGVSNLTCQSGYCRVRSSAVNPATITSLKVTGTDGTKTVVLGQFAPSGAGDAIDWSIPFNVDIKLNSISVLVFLSGGVLGATFDVEVAGK
jgi:hypothetical protein